MGCHWISRALWGDVPSIEPLFDVLKKLHREETQHPCECGSLTARKCLSCSEYVCDGCWLDHTTTIAPPFSKNHVWCDSHGFPVALCCIMAGKDDVSFATVPKYYQKKLTKKWAPFANFDLW